MRKRHAKTLPMIVGIALLGFVLAACAPAADTTSTPESASVSSLGPVTPNSTPLEEETAEFEALYQDAIAEGGQLTVWAGGDRPNQQDALAKLFSDRFPEIDIHMAVDLSKLHGEKISEQLASETLVPDVAQLQTSHDFDRWKEEGELLAFRPVGVAQQFPGYADEDGAFLSLRVNSFVPQYAKVGVETAPSSYLDFLEPEYADHKLVLPYPHDDDAVLYVYTKIVEKYGEEFLQRLADQNPTFLRGTAANDMLVGKEGYLATLTGHIRPLDPQFSDSYIPEEDPFLAWVQRTAIFKQAQNPAAAKLYLAFIASKEYQSVLPSWSTRMDVPTPEGLRPLSDYPNADPLDFIEWMSDREGVAQAEALMESYFGPVVGESPLTDPYLLDVLGLEARPGTA
ncbi:ABC transporter substrate-binding protein [Lysinibacter sp. HNR]|uniref:ABC transporter substrate-binding protein n=1 Tax=Lysinibacter sp. HNR TaxID=3031408 RepID=UPI002434D36F|nr:ABC transporter substrate-binding protein [Lysinibacter sp. HNR]WGD36968.1 ABC transporter substrate-binding protein [Lysinibacter sp. HNR]